MGKRTGAFVLGFCLIAVVARVAAAQEPAAPTGPVAYWQFEEPTGTTAGNSVAGGSAGTHQGGVVISSTVAPVSYPNLHSLDFNGTDAVLNVPNFGTFTNMSVSVWINRAATGLPVGRQTIVSYKENAGGGFVLCLNEADPLEYPRIFLHQGGWQNKEQATAVAASTWVHLGATYTSGALRLYVNGTEALPAAAPTGNMTNPAGVVGIGARSSLNSNWFKGLIDDVRIYSRALSTAEVQTLAAGCPKPTALTAIANGTSYSLSWTAPTGPTPTYTYNVKRAGVTGGPYTTIQQGVSGTTFTDSPVTAGNQYYYVVTAVSCAESGVSNEATDVPPDVTVSPTSGLQTNEAGTVSATFTITFITPAPVGNSVVTVSSGNTAEGLVSTAFDTVPPSRTATGPAATFSLTIPTGTSPSFSVTVTGQDDSLVDGSVTYPISVTASGFALPSSTNVMVTNTDDDQPGITISRTSGLVTTESGGLDVFTVSLSSQPFGPITMALTSTNTAEGTVSPSSITFNQFNWNTPQPVTLTGVDDALIDFTQPYAIVTDPLVTTSPNDTLTYSGLNPPDVTAVNLDNETIPSAPGAWGGCGLLGAEIGLPLLLLGLWRRRRGGFCYRNGNK